MTKKILTILKILLSKHEKKYTETKYTSEVLLKYPTTVKTAVITAVSTEVTKTAQDTGYQKMKFLGVVNMVTGLVFAPLSFKAVRTITLLMSLSAILSMI